MDRGIPPQPSTGSGGASQTLLAESGAEARRKRLLTLFKRHTERFG